MSQRHTFPQPSRKGPLGRALPRGRVPMGQMLASATPLGRMLASAAPPGCAIALCALALVSCGANTLQDQPIGASPLESVMVKSHFPVYWLGLDFQGMQITSVSIDPSEAVTIHYGDCVLGGQYTCVTPVTIVSSPDNSFVPGATPATRTASLRGATATLTKGGATLAIPTGPVVVSVYARNPLLARQAGATMTSFNEGGLPQATLPATSPDTGFDRVPLPGQVPPGVSVPRRSGD